FFHINLIHSSSTISETNITAIESFEWNGEIYFESGVYTYSTLNASGCDSTAILNLTINSSSDVTACDSYEWNGQSFTESGVYTYNTTSVNGYDSTATLFLTINNNSSSSFDVVACNNFEWNGEIYFESGVYTYSTLNASGCDSTSSLVLEIIENPSIQTIIGETNIEPFSTYIYSVNDVGNTFEWNITNGNILTNNHTNVIIQWGEEGVGVVEVIETNEIGCETINNLQVNLGNEVNCTASITQSGDILNAITNPIELANNANWYNIQTIDDSTRYWLMAENTSTFMPTFDCSYFIITSNENCSDTSSVYYYAEEAKSIGQISTSPNPTNGNVKVYFDNSNNQFVRLYLINNSGNILEEFLTKNNELEIDLSSYPSGTYHISFNSPKSKGCLNEDTFQKVSNTIILNK
ncbi:T9SS type A sorting domain-containing protein, partial [Flavobacteriales bacterium]|nr:T9SS type A sorting domain-containing protein [Flavobacteriales bacterium]